MTVVYVVDPVRTLDENELHVAIETMQATLLYGPPQLRQLVEPNVFHLSGDIHKLAAKTEADAQLLQIKLQARIECEFEIRQQNFVDEIRWTADKTN